MTRPRRPSIGPALAGAVDLSALKQRAAAGDGADSAVPANAVEVTEANLEAEVLVRSTQVPVVVLLWTPRSDASAQLGQTLSTLAGEDNGKWALAMINVDAAPRVAQMFGVQAVPTVLAVAGGQAIASFQGNQPADQLRLWINSLLQATAGQLAGPGGEPAEQVDPDVAAARAHLDAGDFDAALAAYRKILDNQPNHPEAKGAVRQITFLKRATTHRPDAVAVSDAAPDDIEAAFAAADVLILNQQPAAAFDRLIALVRRTSGDDRNKVRTRLVELFDLFDPADPEVLTARRNLASALY